LRFANGEHVKEFSGFARQAETRLDRLDAAVRLPALAITSAAAKI
jgi:toxin HigB-1